MWKIDLWAEWFFGILEIWKDVPFKILRLCFSFSFFSFFFLFFYFYFKSFIFKSKWTVCLGDESLTQTFHTESVWYVDSWRPTAWRGFCLLSVVHNSPIITLVIMRYQRAGLHSIPSLIIAPTYTFYGYSGKVTLKVSSNTVRLLSSGSHWKFLLSFFFWKSAPLMRVFLK